MNKYSHYSEEVALKVELLATFQKYQNLLVKVYLKYGFNKLCELLHLKKVWQKNLLFDYLVFEQKVVMRCIKHNQKFFLQLIGSGHGSVLRHILGIQFVRYDKIWEKALEYLNKLYTQKFIDDKLFQLASESFFKLDKRLKRRLDLN